MGGRRWGYCGASVRGAMHERKGTPNQDRLLVRALPGSDVVVAALADGHGSPHCMRSDEGAALATGLAVELLTELVERIGPEGPTALKRHLELSLPQRISHAWAAAVRRALSERPLSDEELGRVREAAGEGGLRRLARNPLAAYGCTLLATAAAPSFIAHLQIGDGDILEIDGGSVRSPVPGDDRLIGNETTSLCDPQAAASFRLHFQHITRLPPEAILLATDGYSNSFADDADLHLAASTLLSHLRTDGPESIQALLPGWLAGTSQMASGDDISLALLFRQDTLEPTP